MKEEKFEHYHFTADPGQKAIRIDKFLRDRIQNVSRTKIQEAVDEGFVTVNSEEIKSNYKVRPGDDISVMRSHEPKDTELIAEDIPLNIVYEDETVIVINKTPGMVVHPGYSHDNGTLVNALKFHLKENDVFQADDDERPGLVHRLDKDTSGLLVVAKTEHALSHLSKQFADRTTGRLYIAIVWGLPKEEEGTITGHLGRHPKNRKIMHVFPEAEHGKHAVTHYKVLEDLGYVSIIECKLETGRTHQIRAHMKHIGHPLFNDADYGGDKVLRGTRFSKYKQFVDNAFKILPRQALHARTLSFEHPKTGERMSFTSELPEDIQNLIAKWKHYIEHRKY
ncbi:MAG: RluA family pseudouridine synthase [Bacteroidota bacterium]|nr:RluA family pseudouridine synthase [Bacteroidota bacterium]